MEYRRPGTNPTLEARSESYELIDKQRRYKQIIRIMLDKNEPMTAKEISVEMYRRGLTPTSERNFSSPRITELLCDGKLEVVGKKKCEYSGKTVSMYELRTGQSNIYDFL